MTPRAAAAVELSPEPITTPSPPPKLEATTRALVTGGAIGLVLAAGNVYTSLKVGIIDGGSITAALVGFSLFATFRRLGRVPYGALENNITQTTASSAAVTSFVMGLVGPIPALALMGTAFPPWAIGVWGVAIGLVGIFMGALLRRRLIIEDALPFPTGQATGELIQTIYGTAGTAVRRTRLLVGSAIVAAAVTWFRDARPAIIPQGTMFGGTIAGIGLGTLTIGMSWSPLLLSTGALVGMRIAASMMVGAILGRGVLGPWLCVSGTVANTDFGTINSWLIWPSLGFLIAGSFVPLLLEGGAIRRSISDLVALARRRGSAGGEADPALSARLWVPLLAITFAMLFGVGAWKLGMPPAVTAIAVAMAMFLANVSARATGETDVTPAGTMATVTLVAVASRGSTNAILAGAIAFGVSTQVAQTLWAFRAGHQVGASPKAQLGGQVLGLALGAIAVVPVYKLVVHSYGLASEKLPSVTALSFKATAEAVHGGLAALPPHAGVAALIAIIAGTAFTLVGRTRLGAWVPSAPALGLAMMLPFSLSMAVFAGAVLVALIRRVRPSFDDPTTMAVASGGIAGESVMGVVIAALLALGRL